MVLLLNIASAPALAAFDDDGEAGGIVEPENPNPGEDAGENADEGDDGGDDEPEPTATPEPTPTPSPTDNNQTTEGAEGIVAQLVAASLDPEAHAGDVIEISQIGGGTIDLRDTDFAGLGSEEYPFAGKITVAQGSESLTIILGESPLFNNISDSAVIDSTVNITAAEDHTATIFAEKVTHETDGAAEWSVRIAETEDEEGEAAEFDFGGVIGTVGENSVVALSVEIDTDNAKLVSENNAGLLCNTLESGASLTVSAITGTADVTAEGGSAGGIVGYMGSGAALIIKSGAYYTGTVTASENAGGLVGYAEEPDITLPVGYAVSGAEVSGTAASGGVIGYLKASDSLALPMTVGSRFSAGTYVGGLFGKLEYTGSGKFSVSDIKVSSTLLKSASNYGGLIGIYTAKDLAQTLEINSVTVSSAAGGYVSGSYGGVIAVLPRACYVNFDAVTVSTANTSASYFGGLVAASNGKAMLDVGSVSVSAGTYVGSNAGGLVGYLAGGVLRLSGTTDLNGSVPTSAAMKVGYIVGVNNGGLVYAVDKGAMGWNLISGGNANNIGNWGDVLHLSGIETKVLTFDETAHTVSVSAASAEIESIYDFARLALHMQLYARRGDALLFDDGSDFLDSDIVLKTDLTLSSGLLGLMRDDGAGNAFTGSIDGEGHTVKLSVSGIYVFSDCHNYLGLFAKTSGFEAKNLTLDGKMEFSLGTAGSNANTFAAALTADNSGSFTGEKITVNTAISYGGGAEKATPVVGGMIGRAAVGEISVSDYTWGKSASITVATTCSDVINAGLIALVNGNGATITVSDSTLSGTIEYSVKNSGSYARVGGLIASIPYATADATNLTIENVTLSGESVLIKATSYSNALNSGTGGLLGFEWFNTNVDLSGLTISGCTLSSSDVGYGGLVYRASGYWRVHTSDATGKGIRFTGTNDFSGTITQTAAPSGLLVSRGDGVAAGGNYYALYMELCPDAYKIDSGAVTLAAYTGNFDEIVGKTISDGNGRSGVVSVATDANHSLIDENGVCNTYQPQIEKSDAANNNAQTRYYYNIDAYREDGNADLSSVNSAEKLLLWSLRIYSADNIKNCFGEEKSSYTITGSIDLTGYSYYPVTQPGSSTKVVNATIVFDNLTLSNAESAANNRTPDNAQRQHYLMHTGLFADITDSISMTKVTLEGTVGMGKTGYGALINGSVSGTATSQKTVTVSGVTLGGVRLVRSSGAGYTTEADTAASAPLLINSISEYATLNLSGVTTTSAYTSGGATALVAGSLIGSIGHANSGVGANKIQLIFSDMRLDSRTSAGTATVYNTYNSIFYKAVFAEEIVANASSYSGVYNFSSTDEYTFGKEISDSKRNPGEQYWFYENTEREANTSYVYDPLNTDKKDKNDAFSVGYLRYIGAEESGLYHELDTNIWVPQQMSGCGTYGDPYQITDGRLLQQVASYLAKSTAAVGLEIIVDKVVLTAQNGSTDYHTEANSNHVTVTCAYDGSNLYWQDASGNKYSSYDAVKLYLSNAYYEIAEDIELSSSFAGLGGSASGSSNGNSIAFSGTIRGKATESGQYPTVTIIAPTTGKEQYGGLIQYSQGSVIENLNIVYEGSGITINCNAVPGNGANSTSSTVGGSFFGGIVGYCIGGDTIIENVSVSYPAGFTVETSGSYASLAAVGGYVGLIGGYAETSGIEAKGGGVIFRSISSEGLTGGSGYYSNPYVGRVLDGYAASEECSLDNTDKNYAIPQLNGSNTSLYASRETYTIEVNDAQGLWLLSAIVCSGAADQDWYGCYRYNGNDQTKSDAYYYGKVRSGDNATDEQWWGGIGISVGWNTSDRDAKRRALADRVSYLVSHYTTWGDDSKTDSNGGYNRGASKIAAYYKDSDDYAISLAEGTYDMSAYGSGFRGIGARYIFNENDSNPCRTLMISQLDGNGSTIVFDQVYNIYSVEESAKGEWSVVGAGLFTVLNIKEGTVQDLTFTGTIKENKESYVTSKTSTVSGVGALAGGFTFNSHASVTMKNLTLDTLTIVGDVAAAGLIATDGYVGSRDDERSSRNITFIDCVYTDLDVTAAYVAGGLVGCVRKAAINVSFTKDTSFGKASIKSGFAASTSYTGAGGLIGSYVGGSYALNVNSSGKYAVSFADLTVQGTGTVYVKKGAGGLLGNCESYSGSAVISNVTFGSLTVKGCEDANSWGTSSGRYAGGIIGIFAGSASLTIDKVSIAPPENGKMAVGNSMLTGGFIAYLSTSGNVSITDCSIIGQDSGNVLIYQNRSSNDWVGGIIGTSEGSGKVTVSGLTMENATVAVHTNSGGSSVGAIVGNMTVTPISIVNTAVRKCTIICDAGGNVGGLVGNSANSAGSVTGYNILLDDNLIGNSSTNFTKADMTDGKTLLDRGFSADNVTVGSTAYSSLGSVTENSYTGENIGQWIGSLSGSVKLVGVRVAGDNRPNQEIGTYTNDKFPSGSYIVYADHDNASGGTVDIVTNPVSGIGNITGLTGDGVVPSLKDGAVAGSIVSEYKTAYANAQTKRWNLFYNKVYSAIAAFDEGGTYAENLSTYIEAGQNGTESQPADFPVLLIDTNIAREITALVNSYVALITNCATASYSSISAATYSYNGSGFTKNASSTLVWNANTRQLRVNGSSYDNTNNRFTLLDVQYSDPTGASSDTVMHLYIPVIVRKVMEFNFYASILAGTDYYSGDYDDLTNQVIAAHGDRITAKLSYQYIRTTEEWQSALDSGEDLMWNFGKSVVLTNNVTVPAGTSLTLVDRGQDSAAYTMTVGSGGIKSDEKTAFESFTSITDGTAWENLPICAYLPLSVEESSAGTYVAADENSATVCVDGAYYRPASDGVTGKYSITVGEIKNGYIEESYFLTIQTPSGTTATLNNSIQLGSSTLSGEVPTRRKNSKDAQHSLENAYVMLGSVASQAVSVTTTTENAEMSTENNSLDFTLTDVLSIDSEVKKTFTSYSSNLSILQRFTVQMYEYDAANAATLTTIPQGTVVRVEYTVGDKSASTQFSVLSATSALNIDLPESIDLKSLIVGSSGAVTLKAKVTLTYTDEGLAKQFPERAGNNVSIGTGVSARSSIAYTASALDSSPINRTELTSDTEGNRYYRGVIELARLNYVAYEYDFGDGTGDISQLGINASDTRLTQYQIVSLGNYDVASLSEAKNAAKIKYTLSLSVKNANGDYEAVDITKYLADITIDGTSGYEVTKSWTYREDTEIPISFKVKTGTELEQNGYVYANYRVNLNVELLDEDNNAIDGSETKDYIIYTNARIYTGIVGR